MSQDDSAARCPARGVPIRFLDPECANSVPGQEAKSPTKRKWHEGHVWVAEWLGCDPSLARRCYSSSLIYTGRPDVIAKRKPHVTDIEKIAKQTERLLQMIDRRPEKWRLAMTERTGLDFEKLRAFEEHCRSISNKYLPNMQGGLNAAAHEVARGTRRLFWRLGKDVTFGTNPLDGSPSTEFGRTVQLAMEAFEVLGDWRRPSEAAAKEQKLIESRLERLQKAKRHAPRLG